MDLQAIKELNKIIDAKDQVILSKLSNWDISATVISVGAGQATVHLPTDPVGTNITAHNPNEISLEVGDQVTIHKVNGNINNSVVLFRKTVGFNNIYVDYATGADKFGRAGNGSLYGSENAPFKTLQYAINRLPKNLNSRGVTICFNNLLPADTAILEGFYGGYSIFIRPSDGSIVQTIDHIWVSDCTVNIHFLYLDMSTNNQIGAYIRRAIYVKMDSCTIISDNHVAETGIEVAYGSNAEIVNCTITNRGNAIVANGMSDIYSGNNSGSGNDIGLYADYNSTIGKSGTQPSGTYPEAAFRGSVIR